MTASEAEIFDDREKNQRQNDEIAKGQHPMFYDIPAPAQV